MGEDAVQVLFRTVNKIAADVAVIKATTSEKEKRCEEHKEDVTALRNEVREQDSRIKALEMSQAECIGAKEANKSTVDWISRFFAIIAAVASILNIMRN